MKVVREKQFTPVTIVLETEKDYNNLLQVLERVFNEEIREYHSRPACLISPFRPSELCSFADNLYTQIKKA